MSRIMDKRIQVLLLTLFFKFLVVATQNTDPQDFAALRGLMDNWQNTPPDWVGTDPCGSKWTGISCTNSRVTSMTLSNMNLKGTLSGDILKLTQLQTLDLSSNEALGGALPAAIGRLTNLATLALVGCKFNGPIPDSIGSLKKLTFLALNSNGFSGLIPPSIGNLTNLSWLDLADNQLEGPIPVSNRTSLGLDMLVNTLHFHLGNNKLSGEIPDKLFSSDMSLIHVLFDSNQLSGTIPQTIGLVKTLEVVRLDRNQLSGAVPSNMNRLSALTELYLSNNNFNGSIPDLSDMNQLIYVDMSNNTFNASTIPSWFSTLQSMTTLMMENTGLQGPIPVSLFNLSNLQSVVLRNNKLSGSVDIGTAYSSQLQLIDLRGNSITELKQKTTNITITLFGNPMCLETGVSSQSYCQDTKPTYSYSTPSNCGTVPCNSNQISSPNCKCAYPYTGTLFFRALGFSNHDNSSYYVALQQSLMKTFQSQNNLPVDSVALTNPFKNDLDYFGVTLQVFPSQVDRFNRTAVSTVAFVLSNQIFKPPEVFSPYYYIGSNYENFSPSSKFSSSKCSRTIMETARKVKDVSPHEFVKAYAAHLKRSGKVELPDWTDIVKTGKLKELAPYDPDWYYTRAASMARKIYLRGGLGVGAFRRIYGGSKRNGSRPPHFCKSSGSVARHILQQLQKMNIVEVDVKGGRRITSSGQRDLDQVAGRIAVVAP